MALDKLGFSVKFRERYAAYIDWEKVLNWIGLYEQFYTIFTLRADSVQSSPIPNLEVLLFRSIMNCITVSLLVQLKDKHLYSFCWLSLFSLFPFDYFAMLRNFVLLHSSTETCFKTHFTYEVSFQAPFPCKYNFVAHLRQKLHIQMYSNILFSLSSKRALQTNFWKMH